jgi:hypothetical protein
MDVKPRLLTLPPSTLTALYVTDRPPHSPWMLSNMVDLTRHNLLSTPAACAVYLQAHPNGAAPLSTSHTPPPKGDSQPLSPSHCPPSHPHVWPPGVGPVGPPAPGSPSPTPPCL